jgi:hypothetical protein
MDSSLVFHIMKKSQGMTCRFSQGLVGSTQVKVGVRIWQSLVLPTLSVGKADQ